jgi:hypothetical protein
MRWKARASLSRTRRAGSLCTKGADQSSTELSSSPSRWLSAVDGRMKKEKKAKKEKSEKIGGKQFLVTFAAYNLPTLRSHYKPSFSGAKKSNSIQFHSIQFRRTSTNFCWLLLSLLLLLLFFFSSFFPKSYPKFFF